MKATKKVKSTSSAARCCGASVRVGFWRMSRSPYVSFVAAVIWRHSAFAQDLRQTSICSREPFWQTIEPERYSKQKHGRDLVLRRRARYARRLCWPFPLCGLFRRAIGGRGLAGASAPRRSRLQPLDARNRRAGWGR